MDFRGNLFLIQIQQRKIGKGQEDILVVVPKREKLYREEGSGRLVMRREGGEGRVWSRRAGES